MSTVENEEIIARIVRDLVQVIRTEAQLEKFYSLLPVGMLPVAEQAQELASRLGASDE